VVENDWDLSGWPKASKLIASGGNRGLHVIAGKRKLRVEMILGAILGACVAEEWGSHGSLFTG
jgi:hypothetical protein